MNSFKNLKRSIAVGYADSWQFFLQSAFLLETKLIQPTSQQYFLFILFLSHMQNQTKGVRFL